MTSFMSKEELMEIGFKSVGENVLLSRNARVYGAEHITIGNNVRIDDFCILSRKVDIGNNVHIAAYSAMYGGEAGIKIDDFANISSRVCVYALSDDFSGRTMTSPMVPDKYKDVFNDPVRIGRHVIIGTGSTILPGVHLNDGCVVGAMSLVKKDVAEWTMVAGIPAKKIKDREKDLLKLEKEFLNDLKGETNEQ